MATDLVATLDRVLGSPQSTIERCDYVLRATRVIWAAMGQGIEPTFLQSQPVADVERFFADIIELQQSKDCFAKIDHDSRLGKRWRRVRGQLLSRFAHATKFDPWMPSAFDHEAALLIKATVGVADTRLLDRLCGMLAMWLETPEAITTPEGVSSLGVYYFQVSRGKTLTGVHLDSRWRHVRELLDAL